jgi:hypothetical protein
MESDIDRDAKMEVMEISKSLSLSTSRISTHHFLFGFASGGGAGVPCEGENVLREM